MMSLSDTAAIDELLNIIKMGLDMRTAQAAYFKTRTKEALITSKEAERAFDRMAISVLHLYHRDDGLATDRSPAP